MRWAIRPLYLRTWIWAHLSIFRYILEERTQRTQAWFLLQLHFRVMTLELMRFFFLPRVSLSIEELSSLAVIPCFLLPVPTLVHLRLYTVPKVL